MDKTEAKTILGNHRNELVDAVRAREAAVRREAALRKLIEGYVELFPDLAAEDDLPTIVEPEPGDAIVPSAIVPKGQDAVFRVLGDPVFRGRYWTVMTMTQELQQRGWAPESPEPANPVRSALTRLAETHERVHKGRGEHGVVFYYHADDVPPPTFVGDALVLAPSVVVSGGQFRVAPERLPEAATG